MTSCTGHAESPNWKVSRSETEETECRVAWKMLESCILPWLTRTNLLARVLDVRLMPGGDITGWSSCSWAWCTFLPGASWSSCAQMDGCLHLPVKSRKQKSRASQWKKLGHMQGLGRDLQGTRVPFAPGKYHACESVSTDLVKKRWYLSSQQNPVSAEINGSVAVGLGEGGRSGWDRSCYHCCSDSMRNNLAAVTVIAENALNFSAMFSHRFVSSQLHLCSQGK